MWFTTYLLLGFFRGPAVEPPVEPQALTYSADDGDRTQEQIDMANAAAIQFMMLAALACEELS